MVTSDSLVIESYAKKTPVWAIPLTINLHYIILSGESPSLHFTCAVPFNPKIASPPAGSYSIWSALLGTVKLISPYGDLKCKFTSTFSSDIAQFNDIPST